MFLSDKEKIRAKMHDAVDRCLEDNWRDYTHLRKCINEHGNLLIEGIIAKDESEAANYFVMIESIYNNLKYKEDRELDDIKNDIPEFENELCSLCEYYMALFEHFFEGLHPDEDEQKQV